MQQAESTKEAKEQEFNSLCELWYKCGSLSEFLLKATIFGTFTKWRMFLFWIFSMKTTHALLYKAAIASYFLCTYLVFICIYGFSGFVLNSLLCLVCTYAYFNLIYQFHKKIQKAKPLSVELPNVRRLYPSLIPAKSIKVKKLNAPLGTSIYKNAIYKKVNIVTKKTQI